MVVIESARISRRENDFHKKKGKIHKFALDHRSMVNNEPAKEINGS